MAQGTITFDGRTANSTVTSPGDATAIAVPASPATMTYSPDAAKDGALGIRVVNPGTGNAYLRIAIANATKAMCGMWVSGSVGVPGTTEMTMMQIEGNATTPATAGTIAWQPAGATLSAPGAMRVTSKGGVNRGYSPASLPYGNWWWQVLYVVASTNSANGQIRAAYYNSSGTLVYDTDLIDGIDTTGTSQTLTNYYIGKRSSVSYAGNIDMDTIIWKTDADAVWPLTPPTVAAPTAPNITAPAFQTVNPNTVVNVPFTVTGSDSSITNRFDFPLTGAPTFTNGTTPNPSFTTGPAGSLYIITQRAASTANSSLFNEATTEVRVASSTDITPIAAIPSGDWTPVGGTNGSVMADNNNATYMESPALTATEAKMRFRHQPSVNRSSGTVTLTLDKNDAGSASVVVRLFQGLNATTPLDTWTITPTQSITSYPRTLSAAVISSITDWGGLRVEVGATT